MIDPNLLVFGSVAPMVGAIGYFLISFWIDIRRQEKEMFEMSLWESDGDVI